MAEADDLSRKNLKRLQKVEPEFKKLCKSIGEFADSYYIRDGLPMRKWFPMSCYWEDEEWQAVHQVVMPCPYRREILKLAHDSSFAGHLGVRKTLDRVWQNVYWPGVC